MTFFSKLTFCFWTVFTFKLLFPWTILAQDLKQLPLDNKPLNPSSLSLENLYNLQNKDSRELCLNCHRGIKQVSTSHPLNWGCTICHGGKPDSLDKEKAHSTLIYDPNAGTGKRNPSSLKVVRQSCGKAQCHSGHQDESLNHVDRVLKSIMGTMAGVISGLRFQWGGQPSPKAKYGIYSITDTDGKIPKESLAVEQLEAIPYFSPLDLKNKNFPDPIIPISKHPGDFFIRDSCSQCHIDSPPPPGQFRSQGCAACHFRYNPEGIYQGQDETIPKGIEGYPASHQLTALPPIGICSQCHKGILRTPRLEEKPEETKNIGNFSFGLGQVKHDVHFSAGMECIDCHTESDIMGDGNIYSKQKQAVEIRCETCHGSSRTSPKFEKIIDSKDPVIRQSKHYQGVKISVGDSMVLTSRNNKMSNVKYQNKKVITFSKRNGISFKTPQTKKWWTIHNFPGHRQKLECTSCHSQWVPECKGCHLTLKPQNAFNPSKVFSENFSHIQTKEPSLMIGPRGKVVPMSAHKPNTFTAIDDQEHFIPVLSEFGDNMGKYKQWEFTNPSGYSVTHSASAVSPHSVGKKVRSCASCHLSPKALGLGEGNILWGKNSLGKYDKFIPTNRSNKIKGKSPFSPDAKVGLSGSPLAGTSQVNARPFNQEEITKILKVGNCIPCHDKYGDSIYKNLKASYKFERKNAHRNLRKKILRKR